MNTIGITHNTMMGTKKSLNTISRLFKSNSNPLGLKRHIALKPFNAETTTKLIRESIYKNNIFVCTYVRPAEMLHYYIIRRSL